MTAIATLLYGLGAVLFGCSHALLLGVCAVVLLAATDAVGVTMRNQVQPQ